MKQPERFAKAGVVLMPPGIVQRLDRGDPNKTMDAAEKFLDHAAYRLFSAVEARRRDRINAVAHTTSDWIGWFRHMHSCLGDADTWDEPTHARFRALRGWCEQFYNRCCDAQSEAYARVQAKRRSR